MEFDVLSASIDELIDEMHRIRRLYVLKETMRYFSKRDSSIHTESVAEHIYGMHVLAQYFLPLEDPHFALDRYRINELMLFHEIGEIETGDIPMAIKTDKDRAYERIAAQRVAQSFPSSMRGQVWERFLEYEDRTTPEAHFTYAIDKIEPIFQMLDLRAQPLFREQGYTQEVALGDKVPATERYPHMRRFLDAWTHYMVANNVFAE